MDVNYKTITIYIKYWYILMKLSKEYVEKKNTKVWITQKKK